MHAVPAIKPVMASYYKDTQLGSLSLEDAIYDARVAVCSRNKLHGKRPI